jgi:hypothetical protein
MWFFDAKVWDEAELRIYELGTIHRQHELEFKQLLNAVRHGPSPPRWRTGSTQVGARPAPTEGAITLATDHSDGDPDQRRALARCPVAPSQRSRGQRRLRRARVPRPTSGSS